MTTYVQARNAIVGYLNPAFTTAKPTIPIYYENTTQIDLDSVGNLFVKVDIDFTDALRLDIDPTPHCETHGEIVLMVLSKEGTGVSGALALYDYLDTLLRHQSLSGVTLMTPFPGRKDLKDGWLVMEMIVPFSFYTS